VLKSSHQSEKQNNQFLLLYALAWAGGSVAYVPLLTVLLPARVSELAGDGAVEWLAYASFLGAIAASIANIGFGWLSDLLRNRRRVALVGWALSCILLLGFGLVETLSSLLVVITLWQLSLNMMLSPLAAWAGDCVPDHQKGQLGGLLSIAPAAAAMVGAFVTIPGMAGYQEKLWLLVMIISICVLPAIILARPKHFPELLSRSPHQSSVKKTSSLPSASVSRMWFARLLIQITEVALFAYLFLWLRSLSESVSDNNVALIYSVALIIGIPVAMMVGRWADLRNRPIFPLSISAAIVACGMLIMAMAGTVTVALSGYLLFGVAGAVFLALHSAQTLRVLPRPERRGRDLGIFNLTNTVPALIMPWLTLALVPVFGFSGLFFLLALLAIGAFAILLSISRKA
jgi:MFS family permease